MAIFKNLESRTWEELQRAHERVRQIYIRRDGFIDPRKSYPDLDELANEMFRRLSGGKDHIVLTAEWIAAHATEEA